MKLEIFFDESGKNASKPMIMGAISIPYNVYNLKEIQEINKNLQDKKLNYHFTKYNGDSSLKYRILELFKVIAPYLKVMRGNIIKYDTIEYSKNCYNSQVFDTMVYSKFPERVFYGLLRCKGNLMHLEADIFMEDATEYEDFPKKFKEQLNVQALYRGENFEIKNCTTVPKFTEIGVELVDIILGVIRNILLFEKINDNASKSFRSKILLINELLENENVYNFFSTIKYFEWDNKKSLKEVNFKDYLDAYLVMNFD